VSDERFRLLFDNSLDAMILADDYGRYLDVNQAACDLFGYSREQMLAMSVGDLITAQSSGAKEQYQKYIQAGRETGEFSFVRADGVTQIAAYSACRLTPGQHLSILRDITARKATETQQQFLAQATDLLASSLDYQTTLQSVARLVVPHLADWCVVHLLNEAGALELVTVAHIDPAKVEVARESSRRYPPRMDEPGGIAVVVRSGKSQWLEDIPEEAIRATAQDEEHYRMLSTSGMKSFLCVPLVARGKPLGTITFIGGESGHRYTADSLPLAEELARHAAIAVDNARLYAAAQKEIAERQRAEIALQVSRDYYRTLTEAVPQLVWTTGPDGVADYFNQQWYAYTGQVPDGTDGKRKGAVHPDDLPHTLERWDAAVRTGEDYEVEYRLKRFDDVYRWFLVRGVPLKNAQGEVLKWFGTCTDIDEQKQAEMEIAALNARLRRSVQETHHRVKNNLQIISALVELQVEENETMVPVSAMTRIGQHARSLAALHDLLTYEAKTNAETDSITTKAALDKLITLLRATTGGRPIRYQVDDFSLPVREGASLALLVSELVSNAVKHGRCDIDVTLTVGGDAARLEVCDDGPGFAPDFDWRTEANTGLGLIDSTGRHDLRGTISYENRSEGGARVVVTFPLPQASSRTAEVHV
jgi:PAS domain S-box-containing protein